MILRGKVFQSPWFSASAFNLDRKTFPFALGQSEWWGRGHGVVSEIKGAYHMSVFELIESNPPRG